MERGQELVGGGHQEGAERERGLALRPRHARQPGRRRGADGHTGRHHSEAIEIGGRSTLSSPVPCPLTAREAKISAIEVR